MRKFIQTMNFKRLKPFVFIALAAFVSGCGLFGIGGKGDSSRTTGW